MRINTIKLKNYRGLDNISIDLDGKSSIIYGVNGAGKTSILNACSAIFTKIIGEATGDGQIEIEPFTEKDVMKGRIEACIELNIDLAGKEYVVRRKRVESLIKKSKSISGVARELQKMVGIRDAENGLVVSDDNIPVFIYYGVNRYIKNNPRYIKKYNEGDKLDAWRDDISSGVINIGEFSQWFRLRQEIENNIIINIDKSYVDKKLDFVRKAILSILGDSFTKIYYKVSESSSIVLIKDGVELELGQMSDGEISSLLLAGDIARRVAIANPSISDFKEADGIVLIDELDLHLHPEWQEKMMSILMDSFPKIQFIVTTHAPKILNSVDDNVKIISMFEEDGKKKAEDVGQLSGWSASDILNNYMGTSSYSKSTEKLIDDLHKALDEKKYDEARVLVDNLQKNSGGKNKEVIRANIVLSKVGR